MSTAGEVCSLEVVCAKRDMTIQAAAKLMRHRHVGTVVIIDEMIGKRIPVGIVTDRDIVVEIVAAGLDPNAITVGDIMGPQLAVVPETTGLLQVVKLMRSKGVRRLPVVDANGNLAGVISVDDLLDVFSEQMTEMVRILRGELEHEIEARK